MLYISQKFKFFGGSGYIYIYTINPSLYFSVNSCNGIVYEPEADEWSLRSGMIPKVSDKEREIAITKTCMDRFSNTG